MSRPALQATDLTPPRRSDPVFGIAAGLYLALLLSPIALQAVVAAGWPDAARNRLYAVTGVVVGLSLVALLASIVTAVAGRPRTYRVTSAGLAVDEPLRTRLLPWAAFEGWGRTDGAVVLRRSRRVDLRLATDDLEDPDAVADAVAHHLGART